METRQNSDIQHSSNEERDKTFGASNPQDGLLVESLECSTEPPLSTAPDPDHELQDSNADNGKVLRMDSQNAQEQKPEIVEVDGAVNGSVQPQPPVCVDIKLSCISHEQDFMKDDPAFDSSNLGLNAPDFTLGSDVSVVDLLAPLLDRFQLDPVACYDQSKKILLSSITDHLASNCSGQMIRDPTICLSGKGETPASADGKIMTDAHMPLCALRQEEAWPHNGILHNSEGIDYRIKMKGDFPAVKQMGKIIWEDGTSCDVVVEPGVNANHSKASDLAISFGDLESDFIFSADSPPSLTEQAVGLALRTPLLGRNPPGITVHCDPLLTDSPIISISEQCMMSSSLAKSKPHITKTLKRAPVGRPRSIAPAVDLSGTTHRVLRTVVKRTELQARRMVKKTDQFPNIEREACKSTKGSAASFGASEEPAVCKRCGMGSAGRDHFDRMHNGLLLVEQESFGIEEKRLRWNMVIKKKLKLRCQKASCQKIVSSSTAMKYHESTCGVPVTKEECPQCGHKIASSYLHQHIMSHNRQAGVYTRPRKKTEKSESEERMSTGSAPSKRKSEEIDEGIVVENKRCTRSVAGD